VRRRMGAGCLVVAVTGLGTGSSCCVGPSRRRWARSALRMPLPPPRLPSAIFALPAAPAPAGEDDPHQQEAPQQQREDGEEEAAVGGARAAEGPCAEQ